EEQVHADGFQRLDLPDAALGAADHQALPRLVRRGLVPDGVGGDHAAAYALAAEMQMVPRAMRLRHVRQRLTGAVVGLRDVGDSQYAQVAVGLGLADLLERAAVELDLLGHAVERLAEDGAEDPVAVADRVGE